MPKVRVLKQLVPHEYARAKEVLLNDELGLLAGRCAPANPYPLFGRTRTWHGRLSMSEQRLDQRPGPNNAIRR